MELTVFRDQMVPPAQQVRQELKEVLAQQAQKGFKESLAILAPREALDRPVLMELPVQLAQQAQKDLRATLD